MRGSSKLGSATGSRGQDGGGLLNKKGELKVLCRVRGKKSRDSKS